MRHADQLERPAASPAKRVNEFGHGMAAIPYAQAAAQRQQLGKAGREHRRRHEGQLVGVHRRLRLRQRDAGQDAQFTKNIGAGHTPLPVQRAVDQHRQPHALQQQGDQRGQIGLAPRAVVAADDHRANIAQTLRRLQVMHTLGHRLGKAEQFGHRFGLDAQGEQDRTEFQIGHAAIEYGAKQLVRLVSAQIVAALGAAADFLYVLRETHLPTLSKLHDLASSNAYAKSQKGLTHRTYTQD